MRTTLRRSATLLSVLTASAAALLLSTTAASAATTNAGLCGGSRSLTVHAGPGDQNVEVIERATAAGGQNVLGVTSGFTWRNLNTGASGNVGRVTERPNTHSWERSGIVRTGRGTVSASWNSSANQTNGRAVVSTLEARGDTR